MPECRAEFDAFHGFIPEEQNKLNIYELQNYVFCKYCSTEISSNIR